MKKLIIMGVFVFAFALTANVAFANCGCGFSWCCPETVVNNSNSAEVWNSVKTISDKIPYASCPGIILALIRGI